MDPIGIVAVVFLFVAFLTILATLKERKTDEYNAQRAQAYRDAAHSLQMEYAERGEGRVSTQPEQAGLFNFGVQKQVRNVMRGTVKGLEITIFDYEFSTFSNKSKQTARTTVVHMRQDGVTLPRFDIHPMKRAPRPVDEAQLKELDFPDTARFDATFLVRAGDKFGVRKLLTPVVRDFLEDQRNWNIESLDSGLWLYRLGQEVASNNLPQHVMDAHRIWDALNGSVPAAYLNKPAASPETPPPPALPGPAN